MPIYHCDLPVQTNDIQNPPKVPLLAGSTPDVINSCPIAAWILSHPAKAQMSACNNPYQSHPLAGNKPALTAPLSTRFGSATSPSRCNSENRQKLSAFTSSEYRNDGTGKSTSAAVEPIRIDAGGSSTRSQTCSLLSLAWLFRRVSVRPTKERNSLSPYGRDDSLAPLLDRKSVV